MAAISPLTRIDCFKLRTAPLLIVLGVAGFLAHAGPQVQKREVSGDYQIEGEERAAPSRVSASAIHFQTNSIEGWRVILDERLLSESIEDTDKALRLLRVQLKEIARKIPPAPLARLREVTLWFSPEYPDFRPTAEYHPDASWLREHGRNVAMAKGIEFTNVRTFESEAIRMPNFTLHELAHAYHDRILPVGFENAEIKAAYRNAKNSGRYDKVERWFGNGRPNTRERAYAMTNPMEYFAETTEAFFSRNDFFPFTHEDLKKHDPQMEQLLTKLWSVSK